MKRRPSLVFSRIHLPLPLDVDLVVAFLERLATDSMADGIVFETRADADGIQHLLGCEPTQVQHLRRLLGHLIPGSLLAGLGDYVRQPVMAAGRTSFLPRELPLATTAPLPIVRALYAALGRRFRSDEELCLQVVLGAGRAPRHTPHVVADPSASWFWSALSGRPSEAHSEVRNQIRDRAAQFSLDAIIRVGVTAASSERRQQFATELASALALAQGQNVQSKLLRQSASQLNLPEIPTRWPEYLTPIDLAALIGWPIGPEQLPGMPPLHPKLLRASSSVESKARVFATSSMPGDDRALGVSEKDALLHGLAIGPTNSGKTTTIEHFVLADIRAGRTVVVIDPKDQTPDFIAARIPRERWADVVWIDPTDDVPIGFNPLDASGRDPDVVADGILAVFARLFEGSWGPRTEDIFSASLRTLARTTSPESPSTLTDLPRLWTDARYRAAKLVAVADDPGLMGFWDAYNSLSPAKQSNWIASPMNKLRSILLRPGAVKILGQRHPRFRLRDVFRERKIVLISLNEGLIGPLTAELIGSLVIAELWQATQERASEKDAIKNPGFVYVDEADRFMHLPISLGDALARSRSLSVGWFLAVQYWEQLPREMRSAVKSNARTKIAWAMSSDDDARTFARLAPGLTDQDFMQLGRFEVYANLVADGMPTGWASARTLPPEPPQFDPEAVHAISLSTYAPVLPNEPIEVEPPETPMSTAPGLKRRRA
jgi:hypothetical protein